MWSAVFFSRSCRAFRWVWALRLLSRRETWGDSTAGRHRQMVSASAATQARAQLTLALQGNLLLMSDSELGAVTSEVGLGLHGGSIAGQWGTCRSVRGPVSCTGVEVGLRLAAPIGQGDQGRQKLVAAGGWQLELTGADMQGTEIAWGLPTAVTQ